MYDIIETKEISASSLYTENKKSKLIRWLSHFTDPFIPQCDDLVSDVARELVLILPTRPLVIEGKFSAKPHGRSKCYIWIQYSRYIIILAFLTYVHNMFHLHSLMFHRISAVVVASLSFTALSPHLNLRWKQRFYCSKLQSGFWFLPSRTSMDSRKVQQWGIKEK